MRGYPKTYKVISAVSTPIIQHFPQMGTICKMTKSHTDSIVLNGCESSRSPLLSSTSFDTHVHVFDPKLGPYAPGRSYTPEDATLDGLKAFNKSLSIDGSNGKLVLVQPSPYKTDCTVLLQCLRTLKAEGVAAYAIVVLDVTSVSDKALYDMHCLGIRGIRLNFQADGKQIDISRLVNQLHQTAQRIRHLPGWVLQLFVPAWTWDVLYDHIVALPVNIIADHVGGLTGPSKLPTHLQSVPLSQAGTKALISLAKQSRVFIKISGLYRVSNDANSNFSDMKPIIQSLAQEVPHQLIWGSDWPHTGEGKDRLNRSLEAKEPFREVDNLGILRNLRVWMGNEAWMQMVQQNPERIYN